MLPLERVQPVSVRVERTQLEQQPAVGVQTPPNQIWLRVAAAWVAVDVQHLRRAGLALGEGVGPSLPGVHGDHRGGGLARRGSESNLWMTSQPANLEEQTPVCGRGATV